MLLRQALEQIHGRERRAGVLKSGDAFRKAFACREIHLLARFRGEFSERQVLPIGRQRAPDETLCLLVEQSGGIALRILQNLAAGWIGSVLVDAGQAHRFRVRKSCMTAGVSQPHRIVWRNFAERVVQRESLHVGRGRRIPFGLMPAASDNPGSGLGFARGCGDHGNNLVPILHVAQIQRHLRSAQTGEMPVPFDESWDGQAS